MMPILSIVIPVYKVEQYVGQTIDSITQQLDYLDQTEIVIVDDGSPDNSMNVVRNSIKGLTNVKIISRENGGLSVARNHGYKESNGEYIWFVDSDDYILPDALKNIFRCISQNPSADVFASFLEVHDESGRKPTFIERIPSFGVATGMEYLKSGCPQGAIQRFIFKRKFLDDNNLSFCPGLLHEDDLFGYKMLYLANTVIVLPCPIYAYRINRGGSIMNSISIRSPQSLIYIHKELKSFMREEVKPEDVEDYQLCIYNEIRNFFRFCINILDSKVFLDYYRECKPYIKEETRFLLKKRKTFLFGLRMMYFPRLPLLVYRYSRDIYHTIKRYRLPVE